MIFLSYSKSISLCWASMLRPDSRECPPAARSQNECEHYLSEIYKARNHPISLIQFCKFLAVDHSTVTAATVLHQKLACQRKASNIGTSICNLLTSESLLVMGSRNGAYLQRRALPRLETFSARSRTGWIMTKKWPLLLGQSQCAMTVRQRRACG